jgi:hypothetical protein
MPEAELMTFGRRRDVLGLRGRGRVFDGAALPTAAVAVEFVAGAATGNKTKRRLPGGM